MFETLFSNEFMPHGMCYMWRPGLLWLHVISDGLIFFSYVSIPVTLIYILHIRKDLIFSKVIVLFVAFVLLCGITHALAVWNVWNGTYWLSGWLKFVTALVSVATAYMLWKLVPTLKEIPTVEKLKLEVKKREEIEKELKINATRLTKESERLSIVNDELQAFAYASSHDLKSPLRGIRQLACWIEEDLEVEDIKLPADSLEHFRLMKTRITRMERLLDDLLVYSKAGNLSDDIINVNTRTLATELLDLLNAQGKVHLHLGERLPIFGTLAPPLTLVIRNLFDNAVKHNEKANSNIWFSCKDVGSYYEFKVTDDGLGVDPENFKKMTKIFSTLKPKDDIEGSGMGLAIIRKIILKFEGDLSFESLEGEGLTVIFTWPKEAKLRELITLEKGIKND